MLGGGRTIFTTITTWFNSIYLDLIQVCFWISAGFWAYAKGSAGRGWGHLPAKEKITMNFCLCGAILNLKAFCFAAITDTMIELIVYDSGSLCGIETELLGILWLLTQVSGLITELAHGLIVLNPALFWITIPMKSCCYEWSNLDWSCVFGYILSLTVGSFLIGWFKIWTLTINVKKITKYRNTKYNKH